MGRDESGTLARLKAHRTERLEPVLARHGGRLVKLTGDGVLAEFPSAVDALSAAIEFQQAMAEANRDRPEDTAIVFRIGLHLGDLIVDGDDLYGDGVNIAARLEAEAPPGGIVVSRAVREAVEGRLKAKLQALGELALKNIERPIRAFRVEWDAGDWLTAPAQQAEPRAPTPLALPLPDKPSIAVLPFQNMSGDPEQEYFADGIVEDIITALSRFKSLFVIARNSSFTYKGKAVDIKQVGRELGVRYVLEGSVRKAGNRVRIAGQLIDSQAGTHLWADRFDGALEDVFDLQDEVTANVAGVIGARIEEVEVERARSRPSENADAYDCFLRGLAAFQPGSKDAADEAHRLFKRAIELDPAFSTPYGWSARCYATNRLHGFSTDDTAAAADVRRLAEAVSRVGPDDAVALCLIALALVWVCGDCAASGSFVDKAITVNPNLATAWQVRGYLSMVLGEHDEALQHYARAARLSPIGEDFHRVQGYRALSLFWLGQNDEAIQLGTNAMNHLPLWLVGPLICTAAYGLAGHEMAHSCRDKLIGIRPGLNLAAVRSLFRFYRAFDTQRLVEGMRHAGLPE